MKILYPICLLTIMACNSHKAKNESAKDSTSIGCCQSTHSKYSRVKVLNEFSDVLNSLVSKQRQTKLFYINKECQLIGAFIVDLSDTLNREVSFDTCIGIVEDHVYHFASFKKVISYSNLAILHKGEIKIYKAINCPKFGDQLAAAINFVKDSLEMPSFEKEQVIIRMKNYRNYGVYLKGDQQNGVSDCHLLGKE